MADETGDYAEFVTVHRAQLEYIGLPIHYWRTLHKKLKHETYDAGLYFIMVQGEKDSLKVVISADEGIKASDPNCVFLIDHAWTYQVNYARAQLRSVPGLVDRMTSLMGIANQEQEKIIDQIFDRMWSFNQTYHLKHVGYSEGQLFNRLTDGDDDDDHIPLWYILDEFGSCIQHSEVPNFALHCFHYVPLGLSFSLLWPLNDAVYGEVVTRNYLPDIKDPLWREICLSPWFPDKMTDKEWIDKLSSHAIEESIKNEMETWQEKDWQGEIFSDFDAAMHVSSSNGEVKIYRVFTTVQKVTEFLTHPRFVVVDDKDDADILWLREHVKDFRSLQESGKFTNQFPNESTVTCKDLLAAVCQQAAPSQDGDLVRRGPEWLPVTFNLNLELPLFFRHYLDRRQRGIDNHWICKPWNLARALDSHITSNLNYLLRLRESGPKVACKYIENPVLFRREDVGLVKFDIRYLVLLTSAKPLILHADKVFWLRFANQPFSLDSFDSYAKHFTVMNYKDKQNLKQIHHHEFIPMFEQQYPDHKWTDIEAEIFKMFRELFEAAISDSPPKRLIHCSQSRSFYAVDLMLKWADDGSNKIIPQVLELNYNPDCERACRYHPNFFNFIFSLLFLGDPNGWPVEKL